MSAGVNRESQARACLVLMLKAPERSKRRLAAEIGAPAVDIARRLIDCAGEDLSDWPGPVRYAVASAADAGWLAKAGLPAHPCVHQHEGNLGERIAEVGRTLTDLGYRAQVFIGTDCPGMTPAYLASAAAALTGHDVVLGPATDGGVVLMGVNGAWPDITALPWSEPGLYRALHAACIAAGRDCAILDMLDDVDCADDLQRVRHTLAHDPRAARRALCRSIDALRVLSTSTAT